MARVTRDEVLDALRQVKDPDRGQDVASLGMITGPAVKDGSVGYAVEVDAERGPRLEPLRRACEQAVQDAALGYVLLTARRD